MAQQAERSRLDLSGFHGRPYSEFFRVQRRSAAGLTGLETIVVNFLGGVSVKLFETLILPYIRKGLNKEDVMLDGKSKALKAGRDGSAQS